VLHHSVDAQTTFPLGLCRHVQADGSPCRPAGARGRQDPRVLPCPGGRERSPAGDTTCGGNRFAGVRVLGVWGQREQRGSGGGGTVFIPFVLKCFFRQTPVHVAKRSDVVDAFAQLTLKPAVVTDLLGTLLPTDQLFGFVVL
jgi:hypothetical protein